MTGFVQVFASSRRAAIRQLSEENPARALGLELQVLHASAERDFDMAFQRPGST
jgi:hypothetical protein